MQEIAEIEQFGKTIEKITKDFIIKAQALRIESLECQNKELEKTVRSLCKSIREL